MNTLPPCRNAERLEQKNQRDIEMLDEVIAECFKQQAERYKQQ